MKVEDLTEEHKKTLAVRFPVWMAVNCPEWMLANHPHLRPVQLPGEVPKVVEDFLE